MPVSSMQHRSSVGLYQNRSVTKENVFRTSSSSPGRSSRVDEILDFGKHVLDVSSSRVPRRVLPDIHAHIRPNVAMPLLALFSQVRIPDAPAFPSYDERWRQHTIVPASSNTRLLPENTFQPMWQAVTNAWYEVDEFVTQNDPLRFPAADAASGVKPEKAPQDGQERRARYADIAAINRDPGGASLSTNSDQDSDEDILLCNMLNYRNIDSVSFEIMLRLIAKAQTRSTTYMARAAQNIYFEAHYGRCPNSAEIKYITSVTKPLDDMAFDSLSLVRRGYVVQYGKILIEYILERIADSYGRNVNDLVRVPDAPVYIDETIRKYFSHDGVAGLNGTVRR